AHERARIRRNREPVPEGRQCRLQEGAATRRRGPGAVPQRAARGGEGDRHEVAPRGAFHRRPRGTLVGHWWDTGGTLVGHWRPLSSGYPQQPATNDFCYVVDVVAIVRCDWL